MRLQQEFSQGKLEHVLHFIKTLFGYSRTVLVTMMDGLCTEVIGVKANAIALLSSQRKVEKNFSFFSLSPSFFELTDDIKRIVSKCS